MSKLVSVLLALCVICNLSCAVGESPGVVIISTGEEETAEPVSLDDAKLDTPINLPNYGTLTFTSYTVSECITYAYNGWKNRKDWYAGNEADYIMLRFDILNDTYAPIDYFTDITAVTVVYNDKLVLEGWCMQYNYDGYGSNGRNREYPSEDYFLIPALYEGHFVVACAVPNAALDEKNENPLKIVFTIGQNEITYNIRK